MPCLLVTFGLAFGIRSREWAEREITRLDTLLSHARRYESSPWFQELTASRTSKAFLTYAAAPPAIHMHHPCNVMTPIARYARTCISNLQVRWIPSTVGSAGESSGAAAASEAVVPAASEAASAAAQGANAAEATKVVVQELPGYACSRACVYVWLLCVPQQTEHSHLPCCMARCHMSTLGTKEMFAELDADVKLPYILKHGRCVYGTWLPTPSANMMAQCVWHSGLTTRT